jgi:glycosyltransferase involved in cell wall biosynthesis
MTRAAISAVVTTLDNAATLERCLASLAWCDEIVVLDSGSTDGTQAIAQRFGAALHVEPFKGYGPQKQSAIDKAAHDRARNGCSGAGRIRARVRTGSCACSAVRAGA